MKKNGDPFTNEEIKLLKSRIILKHVALKHGISPNSRYIYRIMKEGVKSPSSKGWKILLELRNTLELFQKNT